MKITKEKILKKLSEVLDPELGISVTDMGLIYDVKISASHIAIVMTLTTIGCPLYGLIEMDIKNKLKKLGFEKKDIEVKLVFDPPWNVDRMTKKGKKMLGI